MWRRRARRRRRRVARGCGRASTIDGARRFGSDAVGASRRATTAVRTPADERLRHLQRRDPGARGHPRRADRQTPSPPSTWPTARPGTAPSSETVAGIPWGETASYGEIARRIGSPRAARAVGGAVGRNPVEPPHPMPSRHRRGRDDRRIRWRCMGQPGRSAGDQAGACSPARAFASGTRSGNRGPGRPV